MICRPWFGGTLSSFDTLIANQQKNEKRRMKKENRN
jgi:hypothetical protein